MIGAAWLREVRALAREDQNAVFLELDALLEPSVEDRGATGMPE
jgi:hypothetical protein